MSDGAHVQTKSPVSFGESREITEIVLTNPSLDPVSNYRTAIDPSLLLSKPVPVDLRTIDVGKEPVPGWLHYYGTGVTPSEILQKVDVGGGGVVRRLLLDSAFIHDIGASIDLPSPVTVESSDDRHKSVVTDLYPDDVLITASVAFPSIPFFSGGAYDSQYILFPVSSRHIVKTSNGFLHAICAYKIAGFSRIVYLKSENGGETWYAAIVDNAESGVHYTTPSITCDADNGIHITYSKFDLITFPTYWLYAGGATPSGFTLVSDVGGVGYHRLFGGGEAAVYPALGLDPDLYNLHTHPFSVTGGDVTGTIDKLYVGAGNSIYGGAYHHLNASFSLAAASILPPSKSLKFLMYNGIPNSLPADIIVPFVADVPAGFTRYSAQDGYYIYCSNDVGTVVGGPHSHVLSYNFNTPGAGMCITDSAFNNTAACNHAHVGSASTDSVTTDPLAYGVILGKVDASITNLAANALIFTNNILGGSGFTSMSAAGETLHDMFFKGAAAYSYIGGHTTHNHIPMSFQSVSLTSGGCSGTTIYDSSAHTLHALCNHTHLINTTFTAAPNLSSFIFPYTYRLDASMDLTKYGNDLYYRHITPSGTISAPVNISQIYQFYPSFEGVCLVDGNDDVHILWACAGLNANPSNARICYKKKTAGVWGARQDLTTTDEHMLSPSMDIDINGDIHTAWYNATTSQAVQYRKYTGGAWAAIENVDTTNAVGLPSNIAVDAVGNVHLTYLNWTPPATIASVLYRKRTGAGWSASTNLSPGKVAAGYSQYPGQISLDNKGNLLVAFMGKGYGSHLTVYHPVYRMILADGTVVPALGSDATDLFPNDDTEIIYPNIFWHWFPLTSSVYQNLTIRGFSFMYLYDPRNGATKDTADLKFVSTDDALVGDSGNHGVGGSGNSEFTPGGISGESSIQQQSYSVAVKGYIGRSYLTPMLRGDYIS